MKVTALDTAAVILRPSWAAAPGPRVSYRCGLFRAPRHALAVARRALSWLADFFIGQGDVHWLLFVISEWIGLLPFHPRWIALTVLIGSFAYITFSGLLLLFTCGGDRYILNPIIAEFEFPQMREHHYNTYAVCKYLFAGIIVYCYVVYIFEAKERTVELMDRLEEEAANAVGEDRLDATVPRPDDTPEIRFARELIAIRRLHNRGEFNFDVFPEVDAPTIAEPTEQEKLFLKEAFELEAVRQLNDPRILREFVRRRESRMSRERIRMKLRDPRKPVRKPKIESKLNAIPEEGSVSQSDSNKDREERARERRTKAALEVKGVGKGDAMKQLQKPLTTTPWLPSGTVKPKASRSSNGDAVKSVAERVLKEATAALLGPRPPTPPRPRLRTPSPPPPFSPCGKRPMIPPQPIWPTASRLGSPTVYTPSRSRPSTPASGYSPTGSRPESPAAYTPSRSRPVTPGSAYSPTGSRLGSPTKPFSPTDSRPGSPASPYSPTGSRPSTPSTLRGRSWMRTGRRTPSPAPPFSPSRVPSGIRPISPLLPSRPRPAARPATRVPPFSPSAIRPKTPTGSYGRWIISGSPSTSPPPVPPANVKLPCYLRGRPTSATTKPTVSPSSSTTSAAPRARSLTKGGGGGATAGAKAKLQPPQLGPPTLTSTSNLKLQPINWDSTSQTMIPCIPPPIETAVVCLRAEEEFRQWSPGREGESSKDSPEGRRSPPSCESDFESQRGYDRMRVSELIRDLESETDPDSEQYPDLERDPVPERCPEQEKSPVCALHTHRMHAYTPKGATRGRASSRGTASGGPAPGAPCQASPSPLRRRAPTSCARRTPP